MCATQLTEIRDGSAGANTAMSLYIAWFADASNAAEVTACEGDAICKSLMDCDNMRAEIVLEALTDMKAAEDAACAEDTACAAAKAKAAADAKATSGAAAIVPCTAALLAAATIWA
jgi:hypothetical protein